MKVKALYILIFLLQAVVLHAQQSSVALSDVVITGTRTPKALSDTPVPTRLITAKDIERTDATNVQDLLQQEMPGVEFSYAMNQQVNLNMAGFGGQSILFLVDGERLSGETMDNIDFSRLVMAGVQRIEIVRGAASALYGSNAGGGVINIITKEDKRPWSLHIDSRWSKHGGQRYGTLFSMNQGRWNNLFSASFSSMNSYKVNNEPNPQTRVYSEVYGNKVVNVKDRLVFSVTDNMRLTGRVGYFFRQVPRVVTEPERYRDFSAGIKGEWDITNNDNLEIAYSFDQYDKSSKLQALGLDIRTYSNVQNSVRGLYTHRTGTLTGTGTGALTLGFDYMRDYLFNNRLEDAKHRQHSFDAFAQFDWNISERWELVNALRYDYFSEGNISRVTPKLSACYKIPSLWGDWRGALRLSYGMGFRAPTLKERYYDFDMAGIWIIEGNKNLRSEVSHNVNASIEISKNKYDFMVMGYYNNVRNKIATGLPYYHSGDDKQLYLPYTNLDKYSVYGAELSARARWGDFTGRLCYAFTKEALPHDNDGNEINNQYIPARPHSMTWEGTYDRDFSAHYGISVTLRGRFLSAVDNVEYVDYYDISKGTTSVTYPAYALWKLSVVGRLCQKVKVSLAFDNLFNYKPRYYYFNAPITDGTDVMFGLSVDL